MFRGRQFGQFFGVAHASQVGILLPVLQTLLDPNGGQCILLEQFLSCGEVGFEPVQRLSAQTGFLLVRKVVGADAFSSRGQCGDASGVVAIAFLQILC
jgi:hypothetical protein